MHQCGKDGKCLSQALETVIIDYTSTFKDQYLLRCSRNKSLVYKVLFAGKECLQKKNVLHLGSSTKPWGVDRKVSWSTCGRKGGKGEGRWWESQKVQWGPYDDVVVTDHSVPVGWSRGACPVPEAGLSWASRSLAASASHFLIPGRLMFSPLVFKQFRV